MKDKLIFDVTDANTILDSDSVGAFVRAGSDGALIASQSANSQNWLNTASILFDKDGVAIDSSNPLSVSVTDGINVEVDLSHVDDSVALGDGTNLFTSTTVGSDIGLDVNLINSSVAVTDGGGSLTVDGTVAATQSGTWDIGTVGTITNVVHVDDNSGSLTVDASDLDIRDLSAASDSISSWLSDGAGNALSSTGGALDVNITNSLTVSDAALADTAIKSAADTLATAGTAEKVVAANLSDRKYLFVYNNFNRKIFIGASDVDKDNGFPISPGSYIELRAGASVDVYYDSETDGAAIRTLEMS